MAISKLRIENRLRPIITAKLPKDVRDQLVEEDFLDIFNEVAQDLNSTAFLRLERYLKNTGVDTAEDDAFTNYLVQRKIEKVLRIKIKDDDWLDIKWTYLNDRIAFSQGSDGAELDILYLGKPEDIEADSDEIDLPVEVEPEYLALLEAKLLNHFASDNGGTTYQQAIEFYGPRARRKVNKNIYYNQGIKRHWMRQTGDDTIYDIKSNYISLDNFITSAGGDLIYTGD